MDMKRKLPVTELIGLSSAVETVRVAELQVQALDTSGEGCLP